MAFAVAAVFSDHCVLQRNKIISVFGYCTSKTRIFVELKDKNGRLLSKNTRECKEGKWKVFLAPQKENEDCTLEISWTETCAENSEQKISDKIESKCNNSKQKEKIVFTDISIGEVWLAGGQSNMEFELQNCTEGPAELLDKDGKDGGKNVRFYYTNKIGWMDNKFYEAEKNTHWQTWQEESKKSWSAVGYFFAKKLAKDLGVTVGLIGCNWGGTSASAWMRKEYLENDKDLHTYLEEQEEATKGKSVEQQCAEYDEYEKENDVWQKKFSQMYEKDKNLTWEAAEKVLGKCPWPGPKSCKNPYRPTGLYECMLNRIIPYSIKGVLWYQGESDDYKPHAYKKVFTALIENWREDWNDELLPFVFVQLPSHRYMADKDFRHWCVIRQAQDKVSKTVANTFMTCALDLGQFNDIHPKAKKVLGERLELNALANVYERADKESAISPNLLEALPKEDKILLTFNNAPEGFTYLMDEKVLQEYKDMEKNQGSPLQEDFTGFEIAGQDEIFYPATFAFGGMDGKMNSIVLFSKKVVEPLYARYAWYNYGPAPVKSKTGLPLQPFNTLANNKNEGVNHAKIQQIMTVVS